MLVPHHIIDSDGLYQLAFNLFQICGFKGLLIRSCTNAARLKKLFRGDQTCYYFLVAYMLLRALLVFVLSAVTLIACFACNPLPEGIKVFSGGEKGGEQEPTPSLAPPLTQPPVQPNNPTERQVTVTSANSIFSIGMPPGYTEERQVSAQKPIDFWFEYLPTDNVSLEINGVAVEIPARRSSARLGYKTNVTGFSYVIKNRSSQVISYNLHMVPSKAGDSVPAVTREKWIAP